MIRRRGRRPRGYESYLLIGECEKPWLKDPRWNRAKRINDAIMISGLVLEVLTSLYCLIMDDHFDTIDSENWSYEIQTGGFGTGEFTWATDDPQNAFVDSEGLHIVPTLTTEATNITDIQIFHGYAVNLTVAGGDGTCTSADVDKCSVRSNMTLGRIIPPVRSARLITKGKKSIKYGRVEVVAKMPKGDWLWPAIWMMPEDSVYGTWPASGEIDIADLRGNDRKYPRGRDLVTTTLHWGPGPDHDGYMLTYDTFFFKRGDFTDRFFTYGLEWNKDYLFTYEKGKFQGTATHNGTLYTNPWSEASNSIAPFDQKFFLNLKVAVGAQNGYFYNGKFNKPWIDGTMLAATEFWRAKDQWLPTWGEGNDRGMTVKSVKMWQQCDEKWM
ncbi:concanavalin A-like lectin/glucanase domain-containing protein [Boeremia exigua]|uniref:concanavalin A-like lectin/glucanase domain-containing protein n=1 Tax=Boeremia exigua TaxID=749465 RepID=UPI001E8E76A4|nr:concanavalin A-like lectin/glucanase domain-containing protein [Boeremia exigua]KAH6642934.1 concanavalin A-like lectin/glucanase domain-containing protein [Boeremia exigua]